MEGRPILVVDDDKSIRESLALVFTLEGYQVDAAVDGAAACRAVEARRPSLVVLDLHMPVLDGWGFARELKAAGYDPPILIITANTGEAAAAVLDIGAVGFLAKPFVLDDLLGCVRHLRVP